MIIRFNIPFKPRHVLLNYLETTGLGKMGICVKKLINHLLTILLAIHWKMSNLLTKEQWCSKVRYLLLMDKLSAINNVKNGLFEVMTKFKEQWVQFLIYW